MYQCPKRAFLISTDVRIQQWKFKDVYQCPKRAFLISTVSLLNPLKSRVSGNIFACNCQNILTILVFKKIFGFFCKFPPSLLYRPSLRFSILTFKLSIIAIFLLLTGIFLKILLPNQRAPKFSPSVQIRRNNFAPVTSGN